MGPLVKTRFRIQPEEDGPVPPDIARPACNDESACTQRTGTQTIREPIPQSQVDQHTARDI